MFNNTFIISSSLLNFLMSPIISIEHIEHICFITYNSGSKTLFVVPEGLLMLPVVCGGSHLYYFIFSLANLYLKV